MKTLYTLLDNGGYPTDDYLTFIKDYTYETMPVMQFVNLLSEGWYLGDSGFKLHRKYKGKIKLELHTGGWSGNEEIIEAILSNVYLTQFKMRYVEWHTGGHYYFEIQDTK